MSYRQRLGVLAWFYVPAIAAWVALTLWRADLNVRVMAVLYLAGGA
jgi:hypothetical protein